MNTRSIIVNVLIFCVVAAIAVAAFFLIIAPKLTPQVVAQMNAATNGEKLYQANCASCHGANLQGAPDWQNRNADGSFPAPPHDETGHTFHHPDSLILDYIRFGGAEMMKRMQIEGVKTGMPAFGQDLGDQEISDILAFIKSTWSPKIRAYQQGVTAEDMAVNSGS